MVAIGEEKKAFEIRFQFSDQKNQRVRGRERKPKFTAGKNENIRRDREGENQCLSKTLTDSKLGQRGCDIEVKETQQNGELCNFLLTDRAFSLLFFILS